MPRRKRSLIRLKIAVFSPIPRVRVMTARRVKPGDFSSWRSAKRRSVSITDYFLRCARRRSWIQTKDATEVEFCLEGSYKTKKVVILIPQSAGEESLILAFAAPEACRNSQRSFGSAQDDNLFLIGAGKRLAGGQRSVVAEVRNKHGDDRASPSRPSA